MCNNLFPENRVVYEVMWENIVETERTHDNTTWRTLQTHTHNVWYLLLFHDTKGYWTHLSVILQYSLFRLNWQWQQLPVIVVSWLHRRHMRNVEGHDRAVFGSFQYFHTRISKITITFGLTGHKTRHKPRWSCSWLIYSTIDGFKWWYTQW